MEIQKIPFTEVPQLSDKDIAYATGHEALRPFYKYEAHTEAFARVMEDKRQSATDRELLVRTLQAQYETMDRSEQVNANIESLRQDTTFTVATAHQPALFTGPLYYLYKIFSTINLSEHLRKHYPDFDFVPVFINGGEDHDFEEVNHLHLFNKTLTWENDQNGPVGQMTTDTLQPVLRELRDILGDSDHAQSLYARIEKAYTQYERYGEATGAFVNDLFKGYGLVVLNMNDSRLKEKFIPCLKQELIEQPSKELVETATAQLEEAGFSGQAHAREINLFYLGDQFRERIVHENGHYQVLNTEERWSEAELLRELEAHPERFSPNVVMRPLYQEYILPNLAYIGGGGEIAYWLERRRQFEHFGINFPMLVRRNSVLWIDAGSAKKMNKLDLSYWDLFEDVEDLVKRYVASHSENEVSLEPEKEQLEQLFEQVKEKARDIDASLAKKAEAEHAKQLKGLEQLEGRLMKAEKQRHDTEINQLRSLKDRLFPGRGLQERHDNFMAFYLKYGETFFEVLKENLQPLESGFVVVKDDGK